MRVLVAGASGALGIPLTMASDLWRDDPILPRLPADRLRPGM
jgi:hypothetical protein